REFMGERGEPFRRGALRLQRRAGERATFYAGERAQPLDPLIRAAENVEERFGDFGVLERDVLVHRGVAEQHVEQLPGVRADRARRETDRHLEKTLAARLDAEHLADDV